jgi:hypothetical protein
MATVGPIQPTAGALVLAANRLSPRRRLIAASWSATDGLPGAGTGAWGLRPDAHLVVDAQDARHVPDVLLRRETVACRWHVPQ